MRLTSSWEMRRAPGSRAIVSSVICFSSARQLKKSMDIQVFHRSTNSTIWMGTQEWAAWAKPRRVNGARPFEIAGKTMPIGRLTQHEKRSLLHRIFSNFRRDTVGTEKEFTPTFLGSPVCWERFPV